MYIYYIIIVIIVIQFTIKNIIIIIMIQQQCCIDYALIDLSTIDPRESGKRIDLKCISCNINSSSYIRIIPLHYD